MIASAYVRASVAMSTRLREMFETLAASECWPYSDTAVRANWYGELGRSDGAKLKKFYAHRLSFEIATARAVPPGMEVLHACDFKPCCNPRHLSLGTHGENVAESVARGLHPFGERNGHARLTEATVGLIRSARPYNRHDLAARFDVAPQTIHDARTGRTWKHLEMSA